VKYLGDGNIEFIGRVDNQVKIRGYRIELGEIESILQQSEEVSQGVVLAREDKQGDKKLVGYVVPQGIFDREAIHNYLKEKLPEYMVPSVIVELESLPLTANGKVDRKALPDPEAIEVQGGGYTAPRNATEEKLAEIWEKILEVEQVGTNDDFFELGGHSLLAIRLISMIRKELGSEVKIGDVFDYPTIALLSGQLKGKEEAPLLPTIEVKTRPENIPLSFSQERLWFIDQLEGSVQYHVPVILNLKGKLNIQALDYALQNIVNKHEVLRSVLDTKEGYPCQYIRDSTAWQLSIIDDSKYRSDNSLLQGYIKQLIDKPFDLSKDYMFRATLITLDEDSYILVAILHHIASDGWSKSILVREVAELYESFEEKRPHNLNPLKIQYADYAIWQRANLLGEIFNKKLRYWKHKLENVTALQLPTDYKRPAVWSSRGASLPSKIEIALTTQLLNLSQQNGVTLFMTLLAAFKILLHRYTGQNDICVGTPIAGRQQAEVEDLIGFFVNTLALRTDVNSNATFLELLEQVKLTTLEAYENQEVPFEKVVDAVVLERDISRNPIFQAMFVLRNTPEVPELKLKHVTLSAENTRHTTAKFDIQIFLTETSDGLYISTEYCTDLFSEATIMRLIAHFKQLLVSIVNNPKEKIGGLSMMTLDETNYLLDELNNTRKEYKPGANVIDLFEQQVVKTPDALSVIFDKQSYTYGELNKLANQLANHLRNIGVKDETLVPICLERSIQMIVSIWGILKAGAAYVPIDPEYPGERISYMLADTGSKLVITAPEFRNKIPFPENINILELDDTFSLIKKHPVENPGLHIAPGQLAYVIYTSGSTGKPKGAMN
ncbi:MAG: condensation domain-containing protein, partial [Bacteroidota bacterium]|nr:condensation domain-containing protein [Bacteroidota bacterium]